MFESRRSRFVALAAAVLASSLALAGCSGTSGTPNENPSDGEAVPIRLVMNNTVSSLMAVVAEKQGFFKDQGLDVTSTVVTDISKIPPTLGQQYDIGFGVEPLIIRGASQGLKTLVVAGNIVSSTDAPSMELVVAKDSPIKTAGDMEGKILADATLTGNLHTGNLFWLKENGVDPKSVKSVQVATPNMIDQLNNHIIDVAGLQEPFLTLAKKQGMTVVANALTAVAPSVFESMWITSPDWANDHADAIKRFRQALQDAIDWSEANQKDAKGILAEFTKQDVELVQASPLLKYKVEVTPDDLKVWGTAMAAVTDFKGSVDYDSLIYPFK